MKTITTILVVFVMVFAGYIHAQNDFVKHQPLETKIAKGKKNILTGLRSENSGLIESSLVLIAKIKLSFPETNVSDVQTVVDSIAIAGSSATLRYKAYLTLNICADPEWFSAETILPITTVDEFFLSASQRLQNKLLGLYTN